MFIFDMLVKNQVATVNDHLYGFYIVFVYVMVLCWFLYFGSVV